VLCFIVVSNHYETQHNMCWTPQSNTTQHVLDNTIKHNTICVGHHYEPQHNMCWTPLSNTTQYVLLTHIVLCLIVVSNIYCVVCDSGVQHILCCAWEWYPTHIVLCFIVVTNTYYVVFYSGVQHILNTTQYVLVTTIKRNTICVGPHYQTQHNMCWTPL
jgi:hypothetical protein